MQGYLLFVGRADGAFDRRFFPVQINPDSSPQARESTWQIGRHRVDLPSVTSSYYLLRVDDLDPQGEPIRVVCFRHTPEKTQ